MKITTKFSDDKKQKERSVVYTIKIEDKWTKLADGYSSDIIIEGWGKDKLEAESNTYPLIRELYDTLEAFIMENDIM